MKSQSKPCGWIITPAQQQRRDLESPGVNSKTWRRSVDAARTLWSTLTNEELLHTHGQLIPVLAAPAQATHASRRKK